MNITPHRALSLAVASLGDSSRVLESCTEITDRAEFATELRAARDYLASLRDQQTPDRPTSGFSEISNLKSEIPVPRETNP